MRESYDALNRRTKRFAVEVILFAKAIEQMPVIRWLAKQLVAAGTSVAANQRAAMRARSTKELAAKLAIVVEEADEAAFWCELLLDLSIPPELKPRLVQLTDEAQQLRAIFSKGRATVRNRLEAP